MRTDYSTRLDGKSRRVLEIVPLGHPVPPVSSNDANHWASSVSRRRQPEIPRRLRLRERRSLARRP